MARERGRGRGKKRGGITKSPYMDCEDRLVVLVERADGWASFTAPLLDRQPLLVMYDDYYHHEEREVYLSDILQARRRRNRPFSTWAAS